jgi:adenylate cyclase
VHPFRRQGKFKGVEKGFYNACTYLKIRDILKVMQPENHNGQMVRAQLERVLSNRDFSRNDRLSRFLRFVVERHLEGRDSELKESLIAIEVFGRKPDYDPKEDAIVRTEAMRLRARLSKYYAGEGSGDPLIIELPKGGYTPVFRRRDAAEQRKISPRRVWLGVALAGLTVALAGVGWWWVRHNSEPIVVAVLPLENLSHDPANDYFADGITDEIIRNVSLIEGLAVRSRTSSFAFKGKPRNVREVGKLLEANYVLEGSVLRAGEQLRINAQLVRVRDDFPLWSGKFDRELTDVFAIQDEISRGIVNQLRLQLGHGRRRYETSLEAYDLYLHAQALPVQPHMDENIGRFEQVIAKDPSFAPAYAGLASAYTIRSVLFLLDHPPDELSKMRAAAEKAIQLDPLLAEAHDALGLVYARDG